MLLFFEEVYTPISQPTLNYIVDSNQMLSNDSILISNNLIFKQSFTAKYNNFIGVKLYLTVLDNNNNGVVEIVIDNAKVSLKNYQLKSGANLFLFANPLPYSENNELIFIVNSTQICSFECINYVTAAGNFWINNESRRICLKFETLYW